MKYKYIKILSFLLLVTQLSCTNVLDKSNLSGIDQSYIWADVKLSQLFLNELYADRPGYEISFNPYMENITDDSRSISMTASHTSVISGIWTSSTNLPFLHFWAYTQVRKANEFIAGLKTATFDANVKSRYLGEAKFLRAFLYFDMVKRYGGVPIITEPQKLEEDLFVKRNTIDECYTFIVTELNESIGLLPRKKDAEAGRATVGAAMALKARTLLFYASSLSNVDNDLKRWADASKAVQDLIALKDYSLSSDVSRIWLDKKNDETIFEKQYKIGFLEHGWDAMHKPLSIASGIAAKQNPTQELVDVFPMKNGKLPFEVGSGYDSQHPYDNRDLRFYADIVYNQSVYCGRPQDCYDKGLDPFAASFCSNTGYYLRKGINEINKSYAGSKGSEQNWIEIRYAEMLLTLAEAENEAAGPNILVFDALNSLRNRAGITTRIQDIMKSPTDQVEMRNFIRNERRVELCFEQKRYWDLRRWKIAHLPDVLNGRKYTGMLISKGAIAGEWVYKRVSVDIKPTVFQEYMYYMPIPYSEIIKNPNLAQNPTW